MSLKLQAGGLGRPLIVIATLAAVLALLIIVCFLFAQGVYAYLASAAPIVYFSCLGAACLMGLVTKTRRESLEVTSQRALYRYRLYAVGCGYFAVAASLAPIYIYFQDSAVTLAILRGSLLVGALVVGLSSFMPPQPIVIGVIILISGLYFLDPDGYWSFNFVMASFKWWQLVATILVVLSSSTLYSVLGGSRSGDSDDDGL